MPIFFLLFLLHTRNFRFASYLTKCEQSVVLELAGVKEGVWVALILFVGAELFVKGILGKAESSEVGLTRRTAVAAAASLVCIKSSFCAKWLQR